MTEGLNPARLLAVAAIFMAAVVLAWVVASSLGGSDEPPVPPVSGKTTASGCNPEANNAVAAGYYTIQEGDLLSLIAERTCVSEQDLLRLNPGIDPLILTPGECLSLEEGACERRTQDSQGIPGAQDIQ